MSRGARLSVAVTTILALLTAACIWVAQVYDWRWLLVVAGVLLNSAIGSAVCSWRDVRRSREEQLRQDFVDTMQAAFDHGVLAPIPRDSDGREPLQ